MSANTKKQCPLCGSKDVVKIIYGLPGPELAEKAERGEVSLGGCCIVGGDPTMHCKACDRNW